MSSQLPAGSKAAELGIKPQELALKLQGMELDNQKTAAGIEATRNALENPEMKRRLQEAQLAHVNEQTAASIQNRNAPAAPDKAPAGYRWGADGSLIAIPGGPAADKPLTESQGKAAGLGQRAQAAHDILTGFEAKGVTTPGLIKQGAEGVPLIGGALGTLVNTLPSGLGGPSSSQQRVEQAQRDFVNAALRVESGASISQAEFDNARKQYFPQPGDSPENILQKQQAREREIAGLAMQSGRAGKPAQSAQPMGVRDISESMFNARKAIANGVPRDQVIQRLRAAGINENP